MLKLIAYRQCAAWRRSTKRHHEYPDFLRRLREVSADPIFRKAFMRQMAFAANWDCAENRRSGPLFRCVFGPLVYRDRYDPKKRLPDTATLLAAQLALVMQHLNMPISWALLSKACAVAGIAGHLSPESLRVSARRILRDADQGKLVIAGWPAAIGTDFDTVIESLRLARAH